MDAWAIVLKEAWEVVEGVIPTTDTIVKLKKLKPCYIV
jgi:hypothetical protein